MSPVVPYLGVYFTFGTVFALCCAHAYRQACGPRSLHDTAISFFNADVMQIMQNLNHRIQHATHSSSN